LSRLPGDTCGRDWIWDRTVETASAADVEEMAARAWVSQRAHLAGSGFYREKLRGLELEAVELRDLRRLPLTSKAELKAALDAEPPFGPNLCVPAAAVKRVYQTSGTTGTPSVLALTPADMDVWTQIGARSYFATGVHDHSSVLSTFGAGPFVAGHTHFSVMEVGARSVPVGPGDTERVLFSLRVGLADTLLATPSFAQYLANRLEKEGAGRAPLSLTHVVTGGEPGGGIPRVREHIERALGATVTEVMGIGDLAPSLFGECPEQQGMHFCGTGHIWPELVDPDTREVLEIEAGATGELVYTHLTREAMPVLRFLSGDLVRIEGTQCGCGRTSFRMRCLGRRDDMLIVRGVNVYPSAVLDVVGDFRPRVTGRARLVRAGDEVSVEPPVPLEVEVPAGRADGRLATEIETAVRAKLTFRARVQLVPEGTFGDAAYKTRLTRRAGA
jgi:phenylacetate-CoA ligase